MPENTLDGALPTQPRTGEAALGLRRDGRPIWPIKGGSGEGGDPAPTGDPNPNPPTPPAPSDDPAAEQELAEANTRAEQAAAERDELRSVERLKNAKGDAGQTSAEMLAMASVVLDTGARVGELCALRLEDLSPALGEVRIRRRPQNARPDSPVPVEVYPLRRATRAALQRYLLVRRMLMSDVTGGADWLWVSVRGNHGGVVAEGVEPEYRPAGTALQEWGTGRAYATTVTRVNLDLAGTPGWSTLPVRMEQLRRGVAAPELHLVPPAPDAERAAELMDRLQRAARSLAALPEARNAATTGRRARDEARHVLREAWRLGVEHQVQLAALSAGGLLAVDVTRAGWEPELLRALDRALHLTPL